MDNLNHHYEVTIEDEKHGNERVIRAFPPDQLQTALWYYKIGIQVSQQRKDLKRLYVSVKLVMENTGHKTVICQTLIEGESEDEKNA